MSIFCRNVSRVFSSFSKEYIDLFFGNFGVEKFSFVDEDDIPSFELIQSSSTMESEDSTGVATSALNFSEDYDYLLSSSLGENDVDIYKVDKESGKLDKILGLPIAGTYPKDAALFPDNHHLVSLNHESNSMTFFTVDMKKGTLVMNGPEIKVDQPNCIVFHKLG